MSADGLVEPTTSVAVHLDGHDVTLDATATTSLLRALRDAGHTATPGACEQGECGSCSVVIDGRVECACLVPAAICADREIQTVTSLTRGDLAEAFARHGAVQCGFCTPGFVVAAEAALASGAALDRDDLREALAGNLCRCTGYQPIVEAVIEVARRRRSGA